MAFDVNYLERLLGEEWTEDLPPICLDCGYNLTGLSGNRCPECGNVFTPAEVRLQARDIRNELRQLRSCNDMLRLGWYFGFITVGVVAVMFLLGIIYHPGFTAIGSLFGCSAASRQSVWGCKSCASCACRFGHGNE